MSARFAMSLDSAPPGFELCDTVTSMHMPGAEHPAANADANTRLATWRTNSRLCLVCIVPAPEQRPFERIEAQRRPACAVRNMHTAIRRARAVCAYGLRARGVPKTFQRAGRRSAVFLTRSVRPRGGLAEKVAAIASRVRSHLHACLRAVESAGFLSAD